MFTNGTHVSLRACASTTDVTSRLALAFAAGAVFGAAVMYLCDPLGGRRRRALVRDQIVHARHEMDDFGSDARGRAQDLRNRAQGTVAEVRGTWSGNDR